MVVVVVVVVIVVVSAVVITTFKCAIRDFFFFKYSVASCLLTDAHIGAIVCKSRATYRA